MMENTKIEWATHTYNLWWGCQEVSPACDHCYARGIAQRLYPHLNLWGEGSGRLSILSSDGRQKYLNAPYKWDRLAGECGERERVFVQSMGDVFDNYRKGALDDERQFLWTIIRKTPNLDWLLLTKRIGNVPEMLPADLTRMSNVWLGISVVNQKEADRDIPKLLATPARVRFLSCEPLLGPLNLNAWLFSEHGRRHIGAAPGIHWTIAGGESGPKARPSHPDWFRSLRDDCAAAGVAFHFKQWGEFLPRTADESDPTLPLVPDSKLYCSDGQKWDRYDGQRGGVELVARVGKKAAGRMLDGRVHDDFPVVPQ